MQIQELDLKRCHWVAKACQRAGIVYQASQDHSETLELYHRDLETGALKKLKVALEEQQKKSAPEKFVDRAGLETSMLRRMIVVPSAR